MPNETLIGDVDFAPEDRTRWLSLVGRTLGESGFDGTLVSRTDDGLRIEPLYGADPEPGVARVRADLPWKLVQRIDDPDPIRANLQAREEVEQGATGISLVFEGAPNAFGYGLPATSEALETVLEGIPLARTYLRVDAHPLSRGMADWLVAYLGRKRVDPSKLSLSFGIDPAAIFAGTGRLRMSIEALQASMPQSLAHFFALGVPGILLEADGRVFHNAGATEARELGIMLASAVAHLRLFEDARQALVYAAPHIGFAISVDQDQSLSTAKLLALRKLWVKILETYSIPPTGAVIHAETSYRMMSLKDPETNILRTTMAAFAAAVGGADSISILPHTIAHGLPAPFARRIARNTQLVLADEALIDLVAEPTAGPGAIEALTDSLSEAAWAEFQEIQAEGGVLRSLEAGNIQRRVDEASAALAGHLRTENRKMVGTTLSPGEQERAVEKLSAQRREPPIDGTVSCERFDPVRIDQ